MPEIKTNNIKLPDNTGEYIIGNKEKLALIAGPCVIESRDSIFRHAESLVTNIKNLSNLNLIFKSSFDKANRTSKSSFRGVGIEEGLRILQDVRSEFNLPVITDIHAPEQAKAVSEIVDILQIPAFLCRQTDLLLSAGSSGKTILIKKGQFLHPDDMKYAADKVVEGGSNSIMLCERGSCFGYRELIVDFRSFDRMHELGYPVVFDATHSVQVMGGAQGTSGGNRQYVQSLAKASISYGIDALFFECHENPDQAPSDGPNMLPISKVPGFLNDISRLWNLNLELS